MPQDRQITATARLSAGSDNGPTSVFSRIRTDVLNGTLTPGSRISLAQLRQRYATGLGPLREALWRLIGEGLIVAHGQRGFRVVPFSAEDVDDILYVWQTVAEDSLRVAMGRRDDHWEAAIVAAFHVLERRVVHAGSAVPAERDAYEEALRVFHLALTAGARSPRATLIQGSLLDQARRYRLLLYRDPPDPIFANRMAVLESYRILVHFVLTNQVESAVAKLREDLRVWRDGVKRQAGW